MQTWLLGILLLLVPHSAWESTYDETANAIATVAETDAPLFTGPQGHERTAVLMESVVFFESTGKPGAIGDHGHSIGRYQIHDSNLRSLGVTKAELLADPVLEARTALRMMRISMEICRSHPLEERLAQYASGGGTCTNAGGLEKSRHRVGLALRLFKAHPPPARDVVLASVSP